MRNLLKIPIPLFEKNEAKNIGIIGKLMREFLVNLKEQSILEQKIKNLEDKINSKIYELYDLSEDEIQHIESNFGSDSVILRLLLKN